jgi:hypothetical protein
LYSDWNPFCGIQKIGTIFKDSNLPPREENMKVSKTIASIWRGGQIGLNQSALIEFGLGNFDYVVLHYDKDIEMVFLEFTNSDKPGAIKIKKRNTGAWFSAKYFLRAHNILNDKTTGKYALEYSPKYKMYVFNPDNPLVATPR